MDTFEFAIKRDTLLLSQFPRKAVTHLAMSRWRANGSNAGTVVGTPEVAVEACQRARTASFAKPLLTPGLFNEDDPFKLRVTKCRLVRGCSHIPVEDEGLQYGRSSPARRSLLPIRSPLHNYSATFSAGQEPWKFSPWKAFTSSFSVWIYHSYEHLSSQSESKVRLAESRGHFDGSTTFARPKKRTTLLSIILSLLP
jgi:hypothetical protein